jgi:branched-chain amino acid transport system substrate-binding protein
MKRYVKTWGIALVGLSAVAAACGGESGGSAATDTTAEGSATTEAGGATTTTAKNSTATTSSGSTEQPATLDEWEALWETERAEVVEKVKDGKFGKSADGTKVTGPEGFTIDLSKCPPSWSDTEGLTDTEIKIGHTTALSGTLADYGNIAKGAQVVFDKINAAGGFPDSTGKSRKLTWIVKDDGYDATRTIPLVDELIDSEKVFAMITLGSPNTMKTYDKLNERCIPQPFSMTGHPAWGDPVNHPWTTGEQMAYNTEAVLWGSFIEERLDELAPDGGKVTVASLVMNNDFGKSYDGSFKDFLAQSDVKDRIEYVSETIEPQAPTVTDPMTTLASRDPDVFISMVAGAPCTQSIVEAAQNGLKESAKYLFQPSVCKGQSFVGKDKVGGDGEASDGWWVVGGGVKALDSPKYDDDPWVKDARDTLAAGGIDWKVAPTSLTGNRFAWNVEQALRIAGALDGGLSRTNLIVALRSMDMTAPFLLPGAQFNMNGNTDAYFTEASELATYNAGTQTWDIQGELIELSGKSKPCAWDQSAGVCR